MNNRNPLATQTIEQKNKQYAHDCATRNHVCAFARRAG